MSWKNGRGQKTQVIFKSLSLSSGLERKREGGRRKEEGGRGKEEIGREGGMGKGEEGRGKGEGEKENNPTAFLLRNMSLWGLLT